MDDYVRTCMCGAPGRESDARDRLIDVCSRLSALVCLQAVNGDVCVCVSFFRLHRGEEGRVAASHSPEPDVPDRYRSEWAAPDGSRPSTGFGIRGERRPCPTAKQRWARGEPVALTLTALAPQLFRDLVVRSPCVSFHC